MLDPLICQQARLSRDSRFDGLFFIAVKSTGIYCRTICPAKSPAEHQVTYFPVPPLQPLQVTDLVYAADPTVRRNLPPGLVSKPVSGGR